jgi:integrase
MKVFKRGAIYWFEMVFDGQRIQRSTKSKNKRDAEQILSAFHTALVKGEVGITERKPIPTFRAAMSDFLCWSEQSLKKPTHRRYKTSAVALLKHFRETPLDKIGPEEVESFKTTRARERTTVRGKEKRVHTSKPVRPATVNRELACLKALFTFAIKANILAKNPVSQVNFLDEDNQQTRVLSFAEQHSYLSMATPVLRDVATLMLETGMRPEEVYTIRPENVDLAKGNIQVPKGKTAAARRILRLTSTAKAILTRLIDAAAGPFLFPCETDPARPIPKINNAHDRAVKASKVSAFRLYDCRHTWATRAAMSGIDLVTLAAMLGHARIQMVLRYAHPTQHHQSEAMQRLEQYNAMQQISEFERHEETATQQ